MLAPAVSAPALHSINCARHAPLPTLLLSVSPCRLSSLATSGVVFLNDLEKDKEYKRHGRSLNVLLQTMGGRWGRAGWRRSRGCCV
jgi:hypothetical protein